MQRKIPLPHGWKRRARSPEVPPEFAALEKEDVGVTFEFYYNMRPTDRSPTASCPR